MNDEATRRLDGQKQVATQIDTKAAALITLALTGAGLVLGTSGHSALGAMAVVGFAVAILFGLRCIGIRTFKDAPEPEVGPDYEYAPAWLTLDRLIRVKANAFGANRESMNSKADWLKIMIWWLSIPVVAGIVSFYI